MKCIIVLSKGDILDITDELTKLTGYSRDEIFSNGFIDEVVPEQMHRDKIRASLKAKTRPFEIAIKRKDGKLISAEVESHLMHLLSTDLTFLIIKDITEKKKTEDEFNKLSIAVDQSANTVLITTTGGEIEYVNRAFSNITGYSSEEVLGKNPRILKSGIQDRQFYNDLWKTLASGRQWKGEFRNRKKSGEIYWEKASITPVKNKDGRVVSYIAIKEDITRQKDAEQSLQESEEQYRSMVSNIPGVLYSCAPDIFRTVHYVTDAIYTLSGYESGDFIFNKKRSFASLIHPEDREKVTNCIKTAIQEKDQYNIEYRILTADNRAKWVSDNGRPVFDDKSRIKIINGFLFDISERIHFTEELKKAKIQAEEANKAKSEFVANISHEIRTPLNTVLGFTELLESMTYDSKQLKYLRSIKTSGNTLMMLINDLLDLSRIEAGKMNIRYFNFNLENLACEIRNIFQLKAEQKGIDYITNLGKNLPDEIVFDETRLRQILINLVGNAIKFTNEGFVRLDIKAKKSSQDKRIRMELIITDTGIGIPESSYNSIFDSFRQESNLDSRKYKGTGLGLAITKRLVEAMNGRISVKSEVGKGSVFTVVFSGVEYFTNNNVKKESEHLTTSTGESNANIVEDKAQNEILTADKYLKLSERMNVRLYKQWNHFHVKKPLKEVKAFAQELIKLGMENEIGFIKDYGEELYLTIENFDIEEMQIKLKEFPDLLVKLKKIPHEP